jgi:hypothetical protein
MPVAPDLLCFFIRNLPFKNLTFCNKEVRLDRSGSISYFMLYHVCADL